MFKFCRKCKKEKDIINFNKHTASKDGLQAYCIICASIYNKKARKANYEKYFNREKLYRLNNRKKIRKMQRLVAWKRYGINITLKQYNEKLKEQKNACAICEIKNSKLSKSLAVDHCHITGKVRGLLCNYCNSQIIRLLETQNNLITKAKEYLEKYK